MNLSNIYPVLKSSVYTVLLIDYYSSLGIIHASSAQYPTEKNFQNVFIDILRSCFHIAITNQSHSENFVFFCICVCAGMVLWKWKASTNRIQLSAIRCPSKASWTRVAIDWTSWKPKYINSRQCWRMSRETVQLMCAKIRIRRIRRMECSISKCAGPLKVFVQKKFCFFFSLQKGATLHFLNSLKNSL